MADPVAVLAQEARICLGPRCLEHRERRVAVPRHPLACEEARAAHAADRSRHVVVGEPHAFMGELVEHGRLHDGIARAAEGVVPPVVRVEHHDVERRGSAGGKREHEADK